MKDLYVYMIFEPQDTTAPAEKDKRLGKWSNYRDTRAILYPALALDHQGEPLFDEKGNQVPGIGIDELSQILSTLEGYMNFSMLRTMSPVLLFLEKDHIVANLLPQYSMN